MEVANISLGVLALFFVWAILKVGSIATSVWFAVRFPNAGRKIVQAHDTYPRTCFFVGLIDVLLTLIIVLLLFKTKVLAWLGLLLLLLLISVGILAYGPAYYALGRRLLDGHSGRSRVKMLLLGGVLAEAVFWTPVIGQMLSMAALFRGLGALAIALVQNRKQGGGVQASSE